MTTIQWFPGHMTKTKRELIDTIPKVDVVIEVRDARAPQASANPLLDELCASKPRVILLNKSDLADPRITARWLSKLKSAGEAMAFDATKANGRPALISACGRAIKNRYPSRDHTLINALVAGIPNVGKSLVINQLRGKTVVKAANRPGVTRGLTWIKVDDHFRVADTPGVLWPKFDPPEVGIILAAIGAIKDERLDTEFMAQWIIGFLMTHYPSAIETRYKVAATTDPETLLADVARRRGVIISRGEPDVIRMAAMLVAEFRVGKLGQVTIER
jgi:ribosome biogenesis GTPase A